MSEPRVSVIIPVYNTEPYIEEAVRSIMEQTLRELEIIIVDDGSTDGSRRILERLAAEDGRILLLSQANAGQAAARNAALGRARGRYVYFMDSDDLLESDALAICYARCEADRLDFVFFDAVSFGAPASDAAWFDYRRAGAFPGIHTGRKLLGRMLDTKRYRSSVCLNLIRRELLDRAGLRFYAGIIHEDELFTARLYIEAARVAGIARTFFHRRVREESTMTTRFSQRNVTGYMTALRELNRFAAGRDAESRRAVRMLTRSILRVVMQSAWQLPAAERRRLALTALRHYPACISGKALGALLFKGMIKKQTGR